MNTHDRDAQIAALDARWLAAGTNVAQSLNGYVKAFHAADDALRDALALCRQLAAERAADAADGDIALQAAIKTGLSYAKDAARWKERAEYEYGKRMYPDCMGLAVGALDAHMRFWEWDDKQAAIDAALAPLSITSAGGTTNE